MDQLRRRRLELARLALCLAAGIALAMSCPRQAHTQVSSSLGGDLSGRPSNARVIRIDGVPVDLSGAAAGDVLTVVGGVIVPQEPGGGGGGGGPHPFERLYTNSVTANYALPTSPVTVASVLISADDYVENNSLDFAFWSTINVTTSITATVRVHVASSPLFSLASAGVGTGGVRYVARGSISIRRSNTGDWLYCIGGIPTAISQSPPLSYNSNSLVGPAWGLNFPVSLPVPVGPTLFEVTVTANNSNPGNSITVEESDVWIRR